VKSNARRPPGYRDYNVIHMTLAKVPKRLNDVTALASGGGDVARRGGLEHDPALAELDPTS